MALAEESSGTQVATIGTTHTLAAPTTNKTRMLIVNLAAMARGDEVEVKILQKVLATDPEEVSFSASAAHIQAEPILQSSPVGQFRGGTFTLKQTTGTGRSFTWQILTLD